MDPKADRPQAPGEYGIGHHGSAPSEHLPWARVERWLQASRNYWICTTRRDGRPHAKPVWGVWLQGMVSFSTDPSSVTGRYRPEPSGDSPPWSLRPGKALTWTERDFPSSATRSSF